MSLIPIHFQMRRNVIYHTILSVLLRTWIASLGIHEYPWRKKNMVRRVQGCVSIIFSFWLSVNSPSSPGNGSSEERWPMANVGVYSYISNKASSTSSELLYSVVPSLWIFKNKNRILFSYEDLITGRYLLVRIQWICSMIFLCLFSQLKLEEASLDWIIMLRSI